MKVLLVLRRLARGARPCRPGGGVRRRSRGSAGTGAAAAAGAGRYLRTGAAGVGRVEARCVLYGNRELQRSPDAVITRLTCSQEAKSLRSLARQLLAMTLLLPVCRLAVTQDRSEISLESVCLSRPGASSAGEALAALHRLALPASPAATSPAAGAALGLRPCRYKSPASSAETRQKHQNHKAAGVVPRVLHQKHPKAWPAAVLASNWAVGAPAKAHAERQNVFEAGDAVPLSRR